jgi:hypothetical protein
MSRRNSREALMQDDLLKVAEVGIAMQRTDLAERQFAAGVAQTIFEINQQKQQVDLRGQLLGEISTLSGNGVGDKDRFEQAVKKFGAGIDPRDLETLVGAKRAEVVGGFEAVESFEKTTGLSVPKVTRTEIGADGSTRSWQEYDLQAARNEADLVAGEFEAMSPTTRYSVKKALGEDIPLAVRVQFGKQHEEARAILDRAMAEGWITDPTILESLYLPGQSTESGSLTDVGSNKTASTYAPRLLDLDKVKSLPVKHAFNPNETTTIAQRYALAQHNDLSRTRATEASKSAAEELKTSVDVAGKIATILSKELDADIPPEAKAAFQNVLTQLGAITDPQQRRVGELNAIEQGSYGDSTTGRMNFQDDLNAATNQARTAGYAGIVNKALNPGLTAEPGTTITRADGLEYMVVDIPE